MIHTQEAVLRSFWAFLGQSFFCEASLCYLVAMEAKKVVQALKVLQEAGREDLIKEGVLEQALVGLKRPKRSSADRREREELKESSLDGLPGVSAIRGIGAHFPRRSGASLRQHVAAAGRGAVSALVQGRAGQTLVRGFRARALCKARRPQAAMSTCGQMGKTVAHASVSKCARAEKGPVQQAPLAMESGGDRSTSFFEKRKLGGAANMAAPTELAALDVGEAGYAQCEARHRSLAEQVCNEITIINSEEEGELVELYGEDGSDSNRQLEHQRSGRPAGGPVSVGVRAPPGRQLEERAQSGAVCPISREVVSLEARFLDPNIRVRETRLDSRSAILGGNEEEELDYDEETLGAGEQVVAVPQASTSGQAFQGDRLSRREVDANLSRGEVFDTCDGGLAIGGGTRSGVRALKNVDVAIQAGEEGKESKTVGSSGIVQEVAGKSGLDQYCVHGRKLKKSGVLVLAPIEDSNVVSECITNATDHACDFACEKVLQDASLISDPHRIRTGSAPDLCSVACVRLSLAKPYCRQLDRGNGQREAAGFSSATDRGGRSGAANRCFTIS
ncbi:hypothetical protein NDU88_007242 [Pleurodeles waltl]|uniref:Uncharacterized protein n=1 Tax=Pleurodeles waltl TaxID=8319 RepID=A0AAV7SRW9_PLEWA|nr:hypothetical protein NDU88_007242 [Pleurodeles waltl]